MFNYFYYKIIICLIIYILLNISSHTIKNFLTDICRHNFYKTKEIDPSEEHNGKIFYTCGFCGSQNIQEIPKLNSEKYYIEELKANCEHGNGKRYTLKDNKNRVYDRTDNVRHNHSIYGHKCRICNKNIGEFDFQRLGDFHCYGYPRLYRLSDYWNNTWLLGGDNGTILCHRSNDEGITWSEPSIVSNFPQHFCSNVDFFELPNHDIICSYRAIGKPDNDDPKIKYNRKIFSSISKDGGKTWKDHGLIIDNFVLSERLGKSLQDAYDAVIHESNVGFFEPFVQYFNNTITVIYADDFTPMLLLLTGSIMESRKEQSIYSHKYDMITKKWSKKRKLIMNGYIKKSPTNSGLNKKISRDGMPVTDITKDGTYVMVFEGTYRRESYKYFTGGKLNEYHPFEIVISYSKDGENWSNPVEIYHGHNKGSKYSAPFICITETNQLIISFQTDENSVNSGYIGDLFSIMKVIISKPGIPLEEINKDSFFAVTNNNRSPIGGASLWSGMMLIGNIIYTCSSGHPILYSELPLYDDPNKYNDKLKAQYKIEVGDANFFGNKIIIKEKNSIIIKANLKLNSSINIYTYVKPNIIGDCGLVFGFDKHINKNYFLYLINKDGYLLLQKKINDNIVELLFKHELIHQDFNKENIYKMNIRYISFSNEIIAGLNDQEIFKMSNKSFENSKIGFISSGNGTIFTQLLIE
jgi:hypothetical protein